MTWEYKRILRSVNETFGQKYDKTGKDINPDVADSVEDLFNTLGSEGWEMVSAMNLDSGVDSPRAPVQDVVEYIFKRKKQ